MTDRVHPAMEHVETACPYPVPNPVSTQPEPHELVPRNDAVLPPGKRRDFGIHGTNRTLGAYVAPFVRLVGHRPIVLARALRLKAGV